MNKMNFRAQTAGGFGAIITKTANATLTESEVLKGIIIADTTDNTVALTLPAIVTAIENKPIYIMNKDGSNVATVIAPSSAYFGAGSSTSYDTITLTAAGAMAVVIAVDGVWYALSTAVIA